ncbi:hypothetical protein LINGRAHAP2_LOCUS24090 [Linum grandiflorum]
MVYVNRYGHIHITSEMK